ncbi:hypothetical protein DPMN_125862 [Dreissena polymorpha]|uniref:Uncharacterized protein n=1 Tax=Dreissena polymorpha TaxID=45954 RepID=A0A9D4GV44_DREPO|nr:hypothetical protein DPMN_125862 [Dreissena polymorpha]
MALGAPGLVMGPCIVKIDRIVIREVQYQLEVNQCRNEEITVKGNFGWVWPIWARRPRIDRIVIREIQYQFEVNRCRNEEIIVKAIFSGCGLCGRGAPGLIDRIVKLQSVRDGDHQPNSHAVGEGVDHWSPMREARLRITALAVQSQIN